jgi:hypothetical protein
MVSERGGTARRDGMGWEENDFMGETHTIHDWGGSHRQLNESWQKAVFQLASSAIQRYVVTNTPYRMLKHEYTKRMLIYFNLGCIIYTPHRQ